MNRDKDDWKEISSKVAEKLVSVNSVFFGDWMKALRPVGDKLTDPLVKIFQDQQRSESERSFAADVLADYVGENLPKMADLLINADPKSFAVLFRRVLDKGQEEALLGRLNSKLNNEWEKVTTSGHGGRKGSVGATTSKGIGGTVSTGPDAARGGSGGC